MEYYGGSRSVATGLAADGDRRSGGDTNRLETELDDLRAEIQMWRSECLAARIALDELRKLLPGALTSRPPAKPRTKKGFSLFRH
jgi:hypothetical protein